jgi:hypothetical protein
MLDEHPIIPSRVTAVDFVSRAKLAFLRATFATCAGVMLCLGCPAPTYAAEDSTGTRENKLKAAYVFNFLKFVEWPAASVRSELLVCFRGAAGVRDALSVSVENKKIGAHTLAVRELGDGETVDGCNVLYIGADAIPGGTPLTAQEAVLPLLTVSDAENFARGEGIIELVTDHNRLRFNINLGNARRAGVRISAGLLQLAASVESGDIR